MIKAYLAICILYFYVLILYTGTKKVDNNLIIIIKASFWVESGFVDHP